MGVTGAGAAVNRGASGHPGPWVSPVSDHQPPPPPLFSCPWRVKPTSVFEFTALFESKPLAKGKAASLN